MTQTKQPPENPGRFSPVTADQFVEWLFMADDMDPKEDPSKWQKHEQGLREAFIRHMGHDIVDASLLKWALD